MKVTGRSNDAAHDAARAAAPRASQDPLPRPRADDAQACETLVRRFGMELLALARAFLAQEGEAALAVQAAFLSAFRSVPRAESEAAVRSRLRRLLVDACLERLGRTPLEGEVAIESFLPRFTAQGAHRRPVAPWGPALDGPELRDATQRSIGRLPAAQRVTLLLCDVEGLDPAAAAELLGLAPATVSTRLHQARQALRTLLEPHCAARAGAGAV